jgi:hypothetical protein
VAGGGSGAVVTTVDEVGWGVGVAPELADWDGDGWMSLAPVLGRRGIQTSLLSTGVVPVDPRSAR